MSLTTQQAEALQFHLKHIAGLETLSQTELFEHADHETVSMMLEQAARFAEEELAPLAASGDVVGCRLEGGRVLLPAGSSECWSNWCSLGFPSLGIPMEHDGLGFPLSVQAAIQEVCDGANLAFGMMAINLRCAALALIENGSDEQVASYVPGLVSGELASTIAISEPQAGSDVGRILTSATAQDDGSWLLSGSKIWISYADHDATADIIHLVLARVPNGEAGTRGLGLFLVPAEKDSNGKQANGLNILRLEHKMGLHASPTCVLELDNARGHLVGETGKGLQALFVMMNGMRLSVGVQGAAVANMASLHAIQYARERPQGGHPLSSPVMISEHADVRRMLLEMRARSELSRALALRTASCLDRAMISTGDDAVQWQTLAELLLPVTKTLNAESAFDIASQGIQVLGGYGYTNEYPLERLARDIRVASIYEGTSGIQALDFLKRRILADQGQGLEVLTGKILASCANARSPYAAVASAVSDLLNTSAGHFINNEVSDDVSGAYALLQLTGTAVACWNGHELYVACGASEYETGLKAALEFHGGQILQLAQWQSARALQKLPDYHF